MGVDEDAEFKKKAKDLINELPKLQEWVETRRLNGHEPRRAFIIEFAGMPKAGKSLAIETIRHFFSHGTKQIKAVSIDDVPKFSEGYTVHTPAEGVSLRTPNYLKPNLWDFNVWAGAYSLQELLQARHDRYHDLVLLDRGPWDAGCWLEYVLNYRPDDVNLPDDAQKIVEFFRLPHWVELSDLHVLLTVGSDDAQVREHKQRLIEHGGFASKRDAMEKMQTIYQEKFKTLENVKAQLCADVTTPATIHIHTTGRHPKDIALEIIHGTLNLLDAKIAYLQQQSMRPISNVEVYQFLQPFVKLARESRKKELDAYLPQFVSAVNTLSDKQRQSIRSSLRNLSTSRLLAASDRAMDKMVQALEEMLRDVKSQ